jgi:hypothetical protein
VITCSLFSGGSVVDKPIGEMSMVVDVKLYFYRHDCLVSRTIALS